MESVVNLVGATASFVLEHIHAITNVLANWW
jgi:hypothetical protein